MKKTKILFMLSLMMAFSFNTAKAWVTVGDDINCDYSDLQTAIDAAEFEIRTTNQTPFSGNFSVINQSINLMGGYDNCLDAAQNTIVSGNRSHISGLANGHLLTINGQGSAYDVSISGFEISGSMDGSGLHITDINGTVKLENSLLQNNHANQGGGLYVDGPDTNLLVINSSISNNHAQTTGGGIYCENATIKIDATSLVSNNQVFGAQGSGGGLYAYLCNLEVYAGNSDGVTAGFIGNQSTRDGAGIYAAASQLQINGQKESTDNFVFGDSAQPVLFKDNLSDSDDSGTGYGAALFLNSSTVTINGAWFDGNKGSLDGAGNYNSGSAIYAKNKSTVTMNRIEDQPCWRSGLCNLVTNNLHIAMVLTRSHSMHISDTEFSQNTANTSALVFIDSFIPADGFTESTLNFEGNLVFQNQSSGVGLLKSNSRTSNNHCCDMEVNVLNNTITDNQFSNEIIDINDDSSINMHGNIIYEAASANPVIDVYNSAFTDANISCLMSHDVASLPDISLSTVVDNPLFIDTLNNDYHLSAQSPAIDFCASIPMASSQYDIDQQPRGRDEPDTAEFEGLYDLGVDEYYPADIIFSHGFE